MRAYVRIQFNMLITKIEQFKLMKNFPDGLLPLFWLDQIIELPDYFVKDIKKTHTILKINKYEFPKYFYSLFIFK